MLGYQRLKNEEGFNYINKRYALALLATATLLIISQIIIQLTIINMKDDARVINISGRQRMLSQKITKCVFGLSLADTQSRRQMYIDELTNAKNLWMASHQALRYGNAAMDLRHDNSPAVTGLFAQIEPHYQAMLDDSAAILVMAGSGAAPLDRALLMPLIIDIRLHESHFLEYMDKIVCQYDHESNTKLLHLQILEFSILIIALVVLAFEWRVVFKPAQKEIKDNFDLMKRNEDYLNQLFETTPTINILFDAASLKAVKYNAMAVQLIKQWLNVELNENTAFAQVLPGLDGDLSARLLQKIKTEGDFSNLEVGITEGKIVLISASTINHGESQVYLIGLSDITTIKHAATFDSMTAMLNRRAGQELINFLFGECLVRNSHLTICFIDIDGLKFVNDQHGHQEGDWYIKTVAQTLNETLGEHYKGIRYGGDEMMMVSDDPDLDRLAELMQQVGQKLHSIARTQFKPYQMSISYGMCSYPAFACRLPEELIEQADFNMYEHKKSKTGARHTHFSIN